MMTVYSLAFIKIFDRATCVFLLINAFFSSLYSNDNSHDSFPIVEFICDDDSHHFIERLDNDCVIAPRIKVSQVPDAILGMSVLHISRGSPGQPSKSYSILLKENRTLFLGVHDRGVITEPEGWFRTDLVILLGDDPMNRLIVYRKRFESHSRVNVPENHGRSGLLYAMPSVLIF
jgi:hypothetical protein